MQSEGLFPHIGHSVAIGVGAFNFCCEHKLDLTFGRNLCEYRRTGGDKHSCVIASWSSYACIPATIDAVPSETIAVQPVIMEGERICRAVRMFDHGDGLNFCSI
ncbi:MAG: hypothetical protein BWY63_03561 [Chloroflexi bacterium ADurb.Bin360]|nr:MAG: hypothetical protein BWY63_03561 [Chloroflexi bacterium ADurb.Bin360]